MTEESWTIKDYKKELEYQKKVNRALIDLLKALAKLNEREPEEGSAEELLTKPIFGRKERKEMSERTELDKIFTKIECGLSTGTRDFYVMARDRLREYIKEMKEQ